MSTVIIIIAVVTYVVCAAAFLHEAPESYMDEPFHEKQTQRYCAGDWETWDPKITTLPGLYVVGAGYSRIHGLFGVSSSPCGLASLRSLNMLLSVATLLTMTAILRKRMELQQAITTAATLWLLPTSFFYSFLYYTDVGSTLLVLLSYYLAQGDGTYGELRTRLSLYSSAFIGCCAVLFRQTNVVWCLFNFATAVLADLIASQDKKKQWRGGDLMGPVRIPNLVKFVKQGVCEAPSLLARLWPLTIPLIGFARFLYWNGAIVVGDKDNHVPTPHPAQLAYFSLIAGALYGLPQGITEIRNSLRSLKSVAVVSFIGLAAAVLWRGSYVHPFILADNRHYTFYVWQRWLSKGPWHRICILPAYAFGAWRLINRMSVVRPPLWIFMFIICVAAVLVPARLIEPRYWTVPILIAHLNSPQRGSSDLGITAAGCAVVNIITMWIYLYKPFTWPDGSVARFMW